MWVPISSQMHSAAARVSRDVYGREPDLDDAALRDPSLDGDVLLQQMIDSMAVGF